MTTFHDFDEFWAFYLRQHRRRGTRKYHVIGTTIGLAGVGAWLISGQPMYMVLGLIGAYAIAWISHARIERNMPATFSYPLWSLEADFKMWKLWYAGTLDAEVKRVLALPVTHSEEAPRAQ